MKLIANKPPESLFRIFPEIDLLDDPKWNDRWTDRNPAVVHGTSMVIPAWGTTTGGLNQPKWLAFKVLGGKDYVVSLDYGGQGSCAVDLCMYDYLDYGMSDDGVSEPFQTGRVGRVLDYGTGEAVDFTMTVRLDWSRVLLVSAKPSVDGVVTHYANGVNVNLSFSRAVEDFNCLTHLVRDWKNGIDGTWWDSRGKVYRWASLDDIGRRFEMPSVEVPDDTDEPAGT